MSVLLSDIELNVQDLVASYAPTTLNLGNIDRAINRAIEFIQRRLGLPSDEKTSSFYFYEDSKFVDCPTAFNELIGLRYNTTASVIPIDLDPNVSRTRWEVKKDIEILQTTGVYPNNNQVGFTTMNGKNQLVLHGRNLRGSYTVNAFNNTGGITGSTDIASLAQDIYVYKYGAASLKFNINTGLSASYLTFSGLWDIRSAINHSAAYRLYIDFPTGTTSYFTNVELRLQSSAGNYYSMTATVQSDGTAWTSGEGNWSLLSWSLSSATKTGSPDPSAINAIYVYFNHAGGFTTTTGIRVNYLYQITPDYIDMIYYSAYKGTDTTGVTSKIILDTDSDICSFGAYAPDLIGPIALKAATLVAPQILTDLNFRTIYKQDFEEFIKNIGRVYPRKRATGSMGQSSLRRN